MQAGSRNITYTPYSFLVTKWNGEISLSVVQFRVPIEGDIDECSHVVAIVEKYRII